ncbi:MAG: hypothetical protein WB952_23870 [Terriglobales bacterium]
MAEELNKKQSQQPNQSVRQPGQPTEDHPGQQRDKATNDVLQKRPSQGGRDVEDDREEEDQTGQRRAS